MPSRQQMESARRRGADATAELEQALLGVQQPPPNPPPPALPPHNSVGLANLFNAAFPNDPPAAVQQPRAIDSRTGQHSGGIANGPNQRVTTDAHARVDTAAPVPPTAPPIGLPGTNTTNRRRRRRSVDEAN